MKVTIITASYNNGSTIGHTCQSITEQSGPNWEHLIIDGKSSDDTLNSLDAFADPRRNIISEPDDGIYDAMNKGISRASGEVIGFLNADDFYDSKDVILRVSQAFEDPKVMLVYGNLQYVEPLDTSRIVRNWNSEPYRRGMFSKGWMPPHPTVYARRSVFDDIGSFDLSFPICADWEWLYRAFEIHCIPSRYLDLQMVKMRLGGVSNRSIATIIDSNRQAIRAFAKHGKKLPISFFPGKLAHRSLQFFKT